MDIRNNLDEKALVVEQERLARERRKRRNRVKRRAVGAVLLVLAGGGIWYLGWGRFLETADYGETVVITAESGQQIVYAKLTSVKGNEITYTVAEAVEESEEERGIASGDMTRNASGKQSEGAAENVPGKQSEDAAENVPGKQSEDAAENVPGKQSEGAAENASGKEAEGTAGGAGENAFSGRGFGEGQGRPDGSGGQPPQYSGEQSQGSWKGEAATSDIEDNVAESGMSDMSQMKGGMSDMSQVEGGMPDMSQMGGRFGGRGSQTADGITFTYGDVTYRLTEETVTAQIPVGTDVTTKLGTVTTFSRLAAGDCVALVTEESGEEKIITAVYIIG